MLEVVSDANTPPPPESTALDLKVQPGDAIFGSAPPKDTERGSTRKARRLWRYGAGISTVALLCALAWAAGAYYSHGHLPIDFMSSSQGPQAQEGPTHDEVASAIRQMAEEIHALKASTVGGAQGIGQASQDHPDSAPTTSGATINDLIGRVDKLESEFTTRIEKVDEQLSSIQQQISASHLVLASRIQASRKHVHLHDAFDPSRDPTAPGTPRPLGAGGY
ncbi:hypothetical protein DES32_2919 [Methylovirgula ligni]|uniref:Uncharacterized protein n=1 Tax=Methylovirgula ligni TaxID=569860 RepID=A0A3D9YNH6_9HYPH|nr:hypothetical protein [Methylovirgula ligni]REF84074.1 hypothetical protein DES32_2919 [Methylovirgula ligni]